MDDRREFVITTPANAALRQFGAFGNNNIGVWDHSGESTYHSLQTQFVSRFGSGSQFQMSYTLARSRANYAMTDSGQLAANTTRLDNQDPDLRLGSPGDRTHPRLQRLDYLDAANDGRPLDDRRRASRSATGKSRGSSAPAPASRSACIPAACLDSTAAPRAPATTTISSPTASRASRAAPVAVRTSRSSIRTRIRSTDSGSVQIGSAERGDCTGPGYFPTDLAFYKNFPLTNGVKLQFRWDIFNIFNNTNFLFQNLDCDAGPFGRRAQRGADRDRQRDDSRPTSGRRAARGIRARCRSASSCSGKPHILAQDTKRATGCWPVALVVCVRFAAVSLLLRWNRERPRHPPDLIEPDGNHRPGDIVARCQLRRGWLFAAAIRQRVVSFGVASTIGMRVDRVWRLRSGDLQGHARRTPASGRHRRRSRDRRGASNRPARRSLPAPAATHPPCRRRRQAADRWPATARRRSDAHRSCSSTLPRRVSSTTASLIGVLAGVGEDRAEVALRLPLAA